MNRYVDQILDSPAHIFDQIIEKVMGRNLHNSKIELKRHTQDVDIVLFNAIKLILKDLKNEEGVISRFFYNTFGIEFRKNKRREQLILLGSQLKTQHTKVKSELFRIYRLNERLGLTVVDLRRLEDGFRGKNVYFQSEAVINKTRFFLGEIESNIAQLTEYQLSLSSKYSRLEGVEKAYNRLLKKIPRYHELQEETHLLLTASIH